MQNGEENMITLSFSKKFNGLVSKKVSSFIHILSLLGYFCCNCATASIYTESNTIDNARQTSSNQLINYNSETNEFEYSGSINIEEFTLEYTCTSNLVTITGCSDTGENLIIPSTIDDKPVVAIDKPAFKRCNIIKSIELPDSIISIPSGGLSWPWSLESIKVSNSNPNYAAQNGILFNKDLSELIIYPRGKNETSYTIPSHVKTISNRAFHSCASLKEIEIPSSVNLVKDNVFGGSLQLQTIKVAPENEKYTSLDGVLFSKDMNLLISYPGGKTQSFYKIPDSVRKIGSYSLHSGNFSSIEIPNSVEVIEDFAFFRCSLLKSVDLSEFVIRVGCRAFADCHSLQSITVSSKNESYASLNGAFLIKI